MSSPFLDWLSTPEGARWQEAISALAGASEQASDWPRWVRLYDALVEANQQVNLTKLISPSDVAWRHGLESAGFCPWLIEGQTVLDLGSGGGFPALVLAMLRPELNVISVDSVQKKIRAQQTIAAAIEASTNFTAVAERFELLAHQPAYRGKVDTVVARAVAPLPVLLEYAAGFLKTGGQLLALKGPSWEGEAKAAKSAEKKLKLSFVGAEQIPVEELAHCHWLQYECAAPTPKAYPRKPGTPARNPL